MLKKVLLSLMVVSFSCVAARAQEIRLALVKDGRPVATIVKPADAPKWTNQAVAWLNEYIEKVSGTKLAVVTEGDDIPSGTLISVGHTQMAANAGIDDTGLKYDGCKLIVKENVLYLLGRDSTSEIKNDPLKGARGTCRAVLTLLEDHCGVRWFLPGPNGELLPESADISVPANLDKTFIPAFAFSGGEFPYDYGYHASGGATPGSIINNYRNSIVGVVAGETYYTMVPSGIGVNSQSGNYFETHPEYFALINGKRTGEGNHLCSTNPGVKQLLVKALNEQFEQGYELASLGQEDGYRRCQCDECEKQDNYRGPPKGMYWEEFQKTALKDTPCERLFRLHKAVIDEVAQSHPGRKMLLLSYAPTAFPSKEIDYWGDNVWVQLTNQGEAYVAAWKGKAGGFTGYVYWFNITIPMGFNVHATPSEVSGKIRYMHDAGFLGLYHVMETNWGFQGPSFYVLGKMMGDPSLDYNALVEEYCRGVFGKAGSSMMQFFDLLYAKLEKEIPQPITDFDARNTGLPKDFDTVDMYLKLYPPELLDRMETLLDQAAAEADTEFNQNWVKHTREYFDFTNFLVRSLISYETLKQNWIEQNWLDLKARVEAFDEVRARIINYSDAYAHEWFPGHAYFCNWMTADIGGDAVYYIPWENLRPEVLKKGIKGIAMGYGESYYYSFIKEPLTFDFSKGMPEKPAAE